MGHSHRWLVLLPWPSADFQVNGRRRSRQYRIGEVLHKHRIIPFPLTALCVVFGHLAAGKAGHCLRICIAARACRIRGEEARGLSRLLKYPTHEALQLPGIAIFL